MEGERNARTSAVYVIDRPSRPDLLRRRWESVLPREEIACLLAERRYLDLLARLEEAKEHYPHDLEVIRSVRVLQHHLGLRVAVASR